MCEILFQFYPFSHLDQHSSVTATPQPDRENKTEEAPQTNVPSKSQPSGSAERPENKSKGNGNIFEYLLLS